MPNHGFSLEELFLSDENIKKLSNYAEKNVKDDMVYFANNNLLDDYESVQGDYMEALDFVNDKFIKSISYTINAISTAKGQKYPKGIVLDGVENYTVNDFRTHDAQYTQEVIRSNANFRYNNDIKSWRRSAHVRNYDRNEHESGLKDTRELNTLTRSYNMNNIFKDNPYKSSDSHMYNYF